MMSQLRTPFPLISRRLAALLLLPIALCGSILPLSAQTPTPDPNSGTDPQPDFQPDHRLRRQPLRHRQRPSTAPTQKAAAWSIIRASTFNYSDGRWTNSSDTDPSSDTYVGVWHEQLARTFLNIPAATFSLGGGANYAFGGATTNNGTHEEVAVSTSVFGDVTITIDDMGKQMDDYLAAQPIDPNALYVVWGGGNDLFNDDSAANVTATAARATALMSRLAHAGAQYIMVPNVPPLGDIPKYADDPARSRLAECRLRQLSRRAQRGSHGQPQRPRGPGHHAHGLSRRCLDKHDPRHDLPRSVRVHRRQPAPSRATPTRTPTTSSSGTRSIPPPPAIIGPRKARNDALTLPFVPPGKAVNIATRVFVDTGERVSIAGFIVTGDVAEEGSHSRHRPIARRQRRPESAGGSQP